jgi:hypothetical protein
LRQIRTWLHPNAVVAHSRLNVCLCQASEQEGGSNPAIASMKSRGLSPLSVTPAEEGWDDRPPPPSPAWPTPRQQLVRAEGGSSANATPAANLAVGGLVRWEEEEEGAASVLAAQTTTRGSAVKGGMMCYGAVAAAAGMQQLWSNAILDPFLLTILRNTTVLGQITGISL